MTTTRLILEDGTVFEGRSFGKNTTVYGEVVFNTAMTGYQEILTDPSYAGQLVCMTYPLIGNTGVNAHDKEAPHPFARALIVKKLCKNLSNFRSEETLSAYMERQNIAGIQGIDTRRLTLHIREQGAMQAVLTSDAGEGSDWVDKIQKKPRLEEEDLVGMVTTKNTYTFDEAGLESINWPETQIPSESVLPYHIAAIDFGIKKNILKLLRQKFKSVTVFPASASAESILAENPDALFLSNGPGDPARVDYGIQTVRELLGKKPIFGICLGHQILALALGARTFKLKFGHHGANHPIQASFKNQLEITSQNHGYAVDPDSLKNLDFKVEVTHTNLNDFTVAGIRCPDIKAFSVQYHPEASPGPHDSRYLFDTFAELIQQDKDAHVLS